MCTRVVYQWLERRGGPLTTSSFPFWRFSSSLGEMLNFPELLQAGGAEKPQGSGGYTGPPTGGLSEDEIDAGCFAADPVTLCLSSMPLGYLIPTSDRIRQVSVSTSDACKHMKTPSSPSVSDLHLHTRTLWY